MSGFNWSIVGIVAVAVFVIAMIGCFIAPLFIAMARDMWQHALA